MTLQDCKNEVARRYNYLEAQPYSDWDEMQAKLCQSSSGTRNLFGRLEEAAELYAAYRTDKMISAENYCKVVFALQEKVKELEHELKKK